jgi:LEA14-like dessication related protein
MSSTIVSKRASSFLNSILELTSRLSAIRSVATAILLVSLLQACASLGPDYEQPTVILSSLKAIPSEGMAPAFEIGLRIINPNAQPLRLEGVVYTISLQGHELVKGVGKDFPLIEGYSEGTVTLTASANLLAGIQFVRDMMNSPGEPLNYEFKARLDLGGLYPSLRISETGKLDLGNQSKNE